METPKLVVSKHSTEMEGTPRSRRSSSTVNPSERTRSSSINSADNWSPQKERRKPSMSTANPYFNATPRKLSTFYASKSINDTIELQAQRGRKLSEQQFQPTYRTEPRENKKFAPHVVEKIMNEVLEEAVEGMEHYEAAKCRALSVTVCEDIKQKVKWLNYERYKLVCVVHFGSVNGQEMRVASRCLWNQSCDSFASSSVKKGDLYGVALMFGVYKD